MDIKTLHQQGHSIRAIADLTGHSRNTVRKTLRQKAPTPFQKPKRTSRLDPFKPYLEQCYRECALSAVRLRDEIELMGYDGSLDVVQRYLRQLKPERVAKAKLTVRFETPPGQQAQADWAYCGRFCTNRGEMVSIYAFVMVLSFSRLRFVEFTTSMKLEHLLRCQKNAFEFFDGIPQTVLYD
jgi:transposase